MELEKTKNSINGFLAGIVNLLISTVMPFVLRTTMVYVIGIEYAGINSLFASIFNVISLADLGFTSAVVYSMYQPIKENNIEKLSQLLGYYRTIYHYVAGIIFVSGLCVMPFLKSIVTSPIPGNLNIYVLYLGFLFNIVAAYLFGAYRASILIAHQRTDVFKIVQSVIMLVGYTAQIVILLLFRNYYLYLIVMILMNVAVVSSEAYAAKKLFPHIKPKKGLGNDGKKQIFSKVSDLLFKRIGTTVSTSLDSVIISRYLGLAAVAIYGNYYYVYTAAMSFMNNFFAPLTAGIGNKTLNASKEENKVVFNRLNTISNILITFCVTCLFCLYQPFMELWMGKRYMFPYDTVICLAVYFFVEGSRRLINTYQDALGMWHEDRFKPLVGAAVNLFFNILLVKTIGVNGVILSTIISYLFIELPWECHILFTKYFQESPVSFYLSMLKNLLITAGVTFITFECTQLLRVSGSVLNLLVSLVITLACSLGMIFVIYHRNENFQFALERLKEHFPQLRLHRNGTN